MRRVLHIVGVAITIAFGAACDSPTKPMGNPNALSAQLLAISVVPPVTDVEAMASGFANVTLQIERDSGGTIVSAAVDFQVSLSNLPSGTSLTEAHLHLGDVGALGSIVVDTGLVPGEVTASAGGAIFTRQAVLIPTTVAQMLLTTPTSFYFDVHSVRNPSGIARGQLSR